MSIDMRRKPSDSAIKRLSETYEPRSRREAREASERDWFAMYELEALELEIYASEARDSDTRELYASEARETRKAIACELEASAREAREREQAYYYLSRAGITLGAWRLARMYRSLAQARERSSEQA